MPNFINISDSDSEYEPPSRMTQVKLSPKKPSRPAKSPTKSSTSRAVAEVIELTDSDLDSAPPARRSKSETTNIPSLNLSPKKPKAKPQIQPFSAPLAAKPDIARNIFRKPSGSESNGIPKPKPVSRTPSLASYTAADLVEDSATRSGRSQTPSSNPSRTRTSDRSPEKLSFPDSPVKPARVRAPAASRATPNSPTKRSPSRKALAAASAAHLASYASALFASLNASVFNGGLPASTELKWSPRLRSTAGRARWHRSRTKGERAGEEKVEETTEIELASKIVDCEERVRNTLAHEMCHLACWVIDKDVKEGHGGKWKNWAAKVMRARKDISISTRHHYEISYKYQWECENCAKIYGRHSNSIRPETVLCGACRTGRLAPLFATRKGQTPVSPRKGKKAASGSAGSLSNVLDALRLEDLRYDENDVENLADEMRGMEFELCASDEDE